MQMNIRFINMENENNPFIVTTLRQSVGSTDANQYTWYISRQH